MNRKLKAYLGSAIASALLVLGYASWERGALPGFNPTPVALSFAELSLERRGVRVTGTAHYPVQLQLKGALSGDGPAYAFPLFGPGDTTGKEIRVMVLSRVRPDPLLGFEEKTFEGLIRPAGSNVPQGVRDHLTVLGYRFADELMVLEDYAQPAEAAPAETTP